ncbi:hypothetical protein [Nocardia seriolae]|uniref:Protease n=1 Tax=Nocardia seriolae TaxID=37332 RepID=A0ABC9Z6A4_9NOCA|nr:hypothetical protein [Nocardia seriolae]APA97078.1 hypothetical protein NS506_03021 [Nocardia seriolae]OJF81856.1 hypothetical protein NS14008_25160 [Nocardia seriolae]PSK31428.1 hypothetical protein C6575_10195 [Nocardia seriolae]QOW34059.1 hypothetical protein IMZ23_02690 [Nocardia seriolae]QUN18436.1 hypothetical protein KEC46_03035 [Nocardia seriolae]
MSSNFFDPKFVTELWTLDGHTMAAVFAEMFAEHTRDLAGQYVAEARAFVLTLACTAPGTCPPRSMSELIERIDPEWLTTAWVADAEVAAQVVMVQSAKPPIVTELAMMLRGLAADMNAAGTGAESDAR